MKRIFFWMFLPSIVLALVYQSGYRKGLEAGTKKVPVAASPEALQTVGESKRPAPPRPSPAETRRADVDYKYEKYGNGQGVVLRNPKPPEPPKRVIETPPMPPGTPVVETPGFARSGAKVTIVKPPEDADCGCNKIKP